MAIRSGGVWMAGAAAVLLLLTACGDNYFEKPYVPPSAQRAASIHISPLSIDRWEDFVGPLQAQFTITPDGAVALALPKTSITQDSIAELFSAGVQVGLTATQSAPSSGTGGASTAGSSSTSNNSTPSAPASPLPPLAAPNAASATFPTGTVQLDPILTYTTASTIYQEIQLLSHYLNSAALRQRYAPYLVRLQVNISPLARNEPYDTYVDLGLFSKCFLEPEGKERDTGGAEEPVYVIPLIVTDDVETGQASNALNIARQLNATLSAIAGNPLIRGALTGSVSELRDQYKSILGTQYNSLYSVSRGGAENVIQVRLGASRNSNLDTLHETGYSMQTQSHNVSFLALVKREFVPDRQRSRPCGTAYALDKPGNSRIWVTSHTRFRLVSTGEEITVDRSAIQGAAAEVLARFQTANTAQVSPELLKRLIGDMQTNNMAEFTKDASSLFSDKEQPPVEALWTALASVIGMSEYGGMTLELPARSKPPIDQQQTLFLQDNCKDSATVAIAGAGPLSPSNFRAVLKFDAGPEIAAIAVTQASAGGPFSLQFPSLQPLKANKGLRNTIAEVCPDTTTPGTAKGKSLASGKPASADTKHTAAELRPDSATGQTATPTTTAATNSPPSKSPTPTTLSGQLLLQEVLDTRWNPEGIDPSPVGDDAANYSFRSIIYENATPPDTSIGLLAAADTITADPTGAGSIRVLVKIGKGLNDVALTVSGGFLTSAAASSIATQTSKAATVVNGGIKIAPAAASPPVSVGSNGPNAGQVVFDVPLQGLVAGRAITFLATGEAVSPGNSTAKPVGGSTAIISVPVVPLSTNGNKSSTPSAPGAQGGSS